MKSLKPKNQKPIYLDEKDLSESLKYIEGHYKNRNIAIFLLKACENKRFRRYADSAHEVFFVGHSDLTLVPVAAVITEARRQQLVGGISEKVKVLSVQLYRGRESFGRFRIIAASLLILVYAAVTIGLPHLFPDYHLISQPCQQILQAIP